MVIWTCAKCTQREASDIDPQFAPMHLCKGMLGMSIPFTREGAKVFVAAVEREDYIGNEIVQYNANGRPVMAVTHTYDDREDRTVYAPTASLRGSI